MANIFINLLPRRFLEKYCKIKKLTKQLHKKASTVGFIKKSLYKNVIPTFAKVKRTFLREEHQRKCEKDIMKSHLKEHQNNSSRVRPQLFESLVIVIRAHLMKVYNHYASVLIIYKVNRHCSFLSVTYFS